MDEAGRKRKLIAEINALPGAYARRWEDRWAVGLLDLVMKLPGYPVIWGEGKVFTGLSFRPSERQWIEGKRILAAGMPAILIGWKGNMMFVSPWMKDVDVTGDCFGEPGKNLTVLLNYLKLKGI